MTISSGKKLLSDNGLLPQQQAIFSFGKLGIPTKKFLLAAHN
jgi:hypothetical protein